MPFIQFTRRYVVQNEQRGTALETVYDAGEFLECSYPSARHFINRRAAVYVDVPEPKPSEAAAPAVAPVAPAVAAPPELFTLPPLMARRAGTTPVKTIAETTGVRQAKVAAVPVAAPAPVADDADL